MVDEKMVTITVYIEQDLKNKFEQKAQTDERTISSAMRLLIKQYVGDNE